MMDEARVDLCTFFPSALTPPPAIGHFEGNGTLRGFLRCLARALVRRPYDAIHIHAPHVGLLLFLYAISTLRKPPPTVFTLHNSYQNFRLRNRLLTLPLLFACTRVVCCGQASLESLPALPRRLAGSRLRAVANGVDIERVDANQAAPPRAAGAAFVVGYVGRLIPMKNPRCVLEAFAELADPRCRLVFIGEGSEQPGLCRRAAESDLAGRVEFCGLIPRDEVHRHMHELDLFVSASKGEGLPVAVLEAMAAGCPVVVSDIAPHREIASGVDFIPRIAPEDVSGLAREIARMRDLPDAARRQIGARCRRLVESRFSLPAMRGGYLRIYRELADR
jgi:glycosyltransferase involved in cell wall biosynthesis